MWLKTIVLLSLILNLTSNINYVSGDENNKTQSTLPPCRACKVFVESFKKGMEVTQKGKFEGGDTAWEEEKLGSYATSEIRLIEIQEKLCSDVTAGRDQCYAILEEHDADIEDWWFHKQDTDPDIYEYFCIETFKNCCPDHHYGANCTPCPGFPDNVCGNNGKCRGAGTRKGDGKCNCNSGYKGDNCSECMLTHYESYKDDKKVMCSPCHVSCEGQCNTAGPAGCNKCKKGWHMTEDKVCEDMNECASKEAPCKGNKFCVNNEGSYECLQCDPSCDGCNGDGPDMCDKCAEGFIMVQNICKNSEQENRKKYVFITRYLTYFGMCAATCIILQKNTIMAAVVGLSVAVYIIASENILNKPPTPNATNFLEKLIES